MPMDYAALARRGQALARSLMQDTCLVERKVVDANGDPVRVMDPVTLGLTDQWEVVIPASRARFRRPSVSADHATEAGEYQFGLESVAVWLPLDAPPPRRGDRATVSAISGGTDPALLGLRLTVRAILTESHPTKRVVICEEVAS